MPNEDSDGTSDEDMNNELYNGKPWWVRTDDKAICLFNDGSLDEYCVGWLILGEDGITPLAHHPEGLESLTPPKHL